MKKLMTGSKNILGKIIIAAFALSMCMVTPVYATEETEEVAEQEEADLEEEEAEEEQPAEEAPASNNTTTRRTTSRTGRTATAASTAASSAASSEASTENGENADEGEIEVVLPDLEITNGQYRLTLNKNANMRSEPSTEADSRIVIPMGIDLSSDKRVVNEQGEVWYQVIYATLTGYIREDLAEVETVAVEEPQEDAAEGEEGEPQEENPEEGADEAAAEAASTEPAVTPHSIINSGNNDQSETVSEVSTEAVSQTDATAKVKSRKKFDFVVLLFLAAAGIGVALVIAVINLLRAEAKRTRNIMRKHMKLEKKSLFQNIDE